MGRFGNLEFGDRKQKREGEVQSSRIEQKDCEQAAEKEFEDGNFEQALRQYAKMLEFDASSQRSFIGQVSMMIELERLSDATRWVNVALEKFAHSADLLAFKAIILARTGDTSAALSICDAALDLSDSRALAFIARGEVLLAQNDGANDFCFVRAREHAEGHWKTLWQISRSLSYFGQFARALEPIGEAIKAGPTVAVLWLQLAECQKGLGLLAEADRSLQQAIQLAPSNSDAREALNHLRGAGWKDRATAALRRFRIPPKH